MRNHGAKDALIAKRRWNKTETVEHEDIARRKRLDAIHRKLRQGVAEALKEKDQ
jgi:hypothetical protein